MIRHEIALAVVALVVFVVGSSTPEDDVIWTTQLSDDSVPSKQNNVVPTSDGKFLWITTEQGLLYILDAVNGEVIAKHDPFPWPGKCHSNVVLHEQNGNTIYGVYSMRDGRVIAVNPDGKERWMAHFDTRIPNQPTIHPTGKTVYVTHNPQRGDGDAELVTINDDLSSAAEDNIAIVDSASTIAMRRLGPTGIAQNSRNVTTVMFGSYDRENSTSGSTFRCDMSDGTVTELSPIGRNVMAPPLLSRDEGKMWVITHRPRTSEAEVFGWTDESFERSTAWLKRLEGSKGQNIFSPVLSRDENSLFVATERSVHSLNAINGDDLWSVDNLFLFSSPVLSPGGQYLYVMEQIGGRIWEIDTKTGDARLERNCFDAARCQAASTADFALSRDGSVLYYALENGEVIAAKTRTGDSDERITPGPTLEPTMAPTAHLHQRDVPGEDGAGTGTSGSSSVFLGRFSAFALVTIVLLVF